MLVGGVLVGLLVATRAGTSWDGSRWVGAPRRLTNVLWDNPALHQRPDSLPGYVCIYGRVAPTIFIVGAMECGTSALFRDILRVIPSAVRGQAQAEHGEKPFYGKELNHFNMPSRYEKGMPFYVSHFPRCPPDGGAMFAVDATPSYMRHPEVAQRLLTSYADHVAALRFVVMVRNPVERLQAWFRGRIPTAVGVSGWASALLDRMNTCATRLHLNQSAGQIWRSPCRTLGKNFSDALVVGVYSPQVAVWIRSFSPQQLSVVSFKGYLAKRESVMDDLRRFILGKRQAQASSWRAGAKFPAATAPATALDKAVARRLHAWYAPHVRDLMALLRRHPRVMTTPYRGAALTAESLLGWHWGHRT